MNIYMKKDFRISALILSAGEGRRLRPLTDVCPKPLLIVDGSPLLKTAIERVRGAGIKEIVVNVYHRKEMLKEFLKGEPDVIVAEEEFLLGTGGAVVKAFEITGADAILVHNVDVVIDLDLKELINFHMNEGSSATLVCVKGNSKDIRVEDNRVVEFFPKSDDFFTYAGICVIEKKVVEGKRVERMCLVRDILVPYLKVRSLSAFIYRGRWYDVGTPRGWLCVD